METNEWQQLLQQVAKQLHPATAVSPTIGLDSELEDDGRGYVWRVVCNDQPHYLFCVTIPRLKPRETLQRLLNSTTICRLQDPIPYRYNINRVYHCLADCFDVRDHEIARQQTWVVLG